jgi:magnesium chelatase family protein
MSEEEVLEVTKIYSIAGELTTTNPIISFRPFRSPHHTSSPMAMVGGGTNLKPGEISLAHKGVLFLDEMPEFNPYVVELLRQPLEEEEIRINRVRGAVTFPAKFLLVAACNPCKCGYLGDPRKECSCTGAQLSHYRSRLSGPILDRIDLNVELMPVEYKDIMADADGGLKQLGSEEMAESVAKARKIQARRYAKMRVEYNSQLRGRELQSFCQLSEDGRNLMRRAFEKMSLTMRSHDKILKVARTIADLEEAEEIGVVHLAEALQYRRTEDRREA